MSLHTRDSVQHVLAHVAFFLRHLSQQLQNSRHCDCAAELCPSQLPPPVGECRSYWDRRVVPAVWLLRRDRHLLFQVVLDGDETGRLALDFRKEFDAIVDSFFVGGTCGPGGLVLYHDGEKREQRSSIRKVPTIVDNRETVPHSTNSRRRSIPRAQSLWSRRASRRRKGYERLWNKHQEKGTGKRTLANGDVTEFSPSQRLHIHHSQLQWIVLPQALNNGRQAEEIFKSAKATGVLPLRNRRGRRRRPEDKLRIKDRC